MKPRVFIGCSSEAKPLSEAIHVALSGVAKPTVWSQGQSVFELSSGTLESLEKAKDEFDFAVLVLTPDDLTESRGESERSPRDNVIFELGLFIGAIGRARTFIVCDYKHSLKVPSDLSGITIATFDSSTDDDPSQVVSTAVYQIKQRVKALGSLAKEMDDSSGIIQIALLGSTSHAIECDSDCTTALSGFYRTFIDELDRTPFGITTCGPEPIRTVLYDLYRKRLESHSRSQLQEFQNRIRWYWRKGGTVGLNHEPPIFRSREAKDQTERRELEIKESQMILSIAGRTGTRDYLEELLAKHSNPDSDFTFESKPILLLGWFGGETLRFMTDNEAAMRPLTTQYADLEPFAEAANWCDEGRAQELARTLILTIRRLYSHLL